MKDNVFYGFCDLNDVVFLVFLSGFLSFVGGCMLGYACASRHQTLPLRPRLHARVATAV
jgi:hypothetical protein